jgi:hypothetical protein
MSQHTQKNHHRVGHALLLCLLIVSAMLSSGCASTLRFSVTAETNTNKNAPVYLVVRSVDGQAFLAEHYNAVAEKVFQGVPDKSILERKIIFPGQSETIQIDTPAEGNIGVYILFSEPGENWRIPLQAPFPEEVLISLGKNQIRRVQIRR